MGKIVAANIFERIEKKYEMDMETYNKLKERLCPHMQTDVYGLHTICNIYYDTPDFELIRKSIEGPVYKEKLRLRSYGIPTDKSIVFVEIKKKCQGIVYKRREGMSLQDARYYLHQGVKPMMDSQIRNEIDYFLKYYHPVPKVYIAYDRIAMYGKENEDIRMTFDFRIRFRDNDLELKNGDYGRLLRDEDKVLMEIKVPTAYPLWLTNILTELEIFPISFSKYGMIYKQMMINKGEKEKCLTA